MKVRKLCLPSIESSLRAFREIVERYRSHHMGNFVAPIGEYRACPISEPLCYSRACLKRKALATTLTEESDIAAAAMIGDSRMPNVG